MSESAGPLPHALFDRVQKAVTGGRVSLHPRLGGLSLLSRLLPRRAGGQLRAQLLRRAGFTIGAGTLLHETPRLLNLGSSHASHLVIGRDCLIESGCQFDLSDRISLGDDVVLDHEVLILTKSHELGPPEHRAGAPLHGPVRVERGAWIGARSIVLPGVIVGQGAVVSPGSLVTKNVAPNTRVSGMPAKQVEVFAP